MKDFPLSIHAKLRGWCLGSPPSFPPDPIRSPGPRGLTSSPFFLLTKRVPVSSVALLLCSIWGVTTLNLAEEERQWKSSDGRIITAELLASTETSVRLKLSNGTAVDVPLSRLAASDIAYVKEWNSRNADSPRIKVVSLKAQDAIRDELVGLPGGPTLKARAPSGSKFLKMEITIGQPISGKSYEIETKDFTLECETADHAITSYPQTFSWEMFFTTAKIYKSTDSDGKIKRFSSCFRKIVNDDVIRDTTKPSQCGFYFLIPGDLKPVRLIYKQSEKTTYIAKEVQVVIKLP